jgi:hypothetical protein
MAITCPRCGSEFDATLFEFGHHVRCQCGEEVEYPGTDSRAGHIVREKERVDEVRRKAEGEGRNAKY